jgi:purine-binding chemotaxis protein CheW
MLAFMLGGEMFGVDILSVKEIRGWSPVTRIPQSPPQVLGVLNLRGAVVPIIDLRRRFELQSADFSPTTVIIVLSLRTGEGTRECGVVVDGVSDVVDVAPGSLKPPPSFGGQSRPRCIRGLAQIGERMLILLDVEQLVTSDLASMPGVDAAA